MREYKFCVQDCYYLTPTEVEQETLHKDSGGYKPHICTKFSEQVFHMGYHPNLVRVEGCDYCRAGSNPAHTTNL